MNINIAEIARNEEQALRSHMNVIAERLDPTNTGVEETVRRAAFLVRHNYVKVKDYSAQTNTIQFVVQDASLATVTLKLYDQTLFCTCTSDGFCRHRLAAIFSMYQYIDSLSGWLENFRSKAQVQQLSFLKEERTPESWLKFVQDVYKRNLYQQQNLNPYLLDSIFSDMLTQINKHKPLEREWQPMYQLFTRVALLSHTWKHFSATNTEAAQSFYRRFITDEIEHIEAIVKTTSAQSRLFALDPFYNTLKDMTHFFLLNQTTFVDHRIEIYLLLWNHIFTSTKEREDEFDRLSKANHYSDDLSLEHIKAIFLVMLDKTDELHDYLKDIQAKDVLSWIELARTAGLNNQELVRRQIIERIIPLLSEFISSWLVAHYRMSFVKKFEEERQGIPLSDELEEILFSAYGKYGIQPYSLFLIDKGRYRDWAALHQLHPSSLAFLEICGLKTVLEHQPNVLLPLYHSLVIEEINQKSRAHYKSAVRLLKKMKAAAKKSGKNEFWNDYMTTIRKNFKRMRALQEEIEKGNLML